MNKLINIPDEWKTLIACLRCAIHDTPIPAGLKSTEWAVLLRQARQHSVEYFLFPWLSKNIPELFSARASVDTASAVSAWRALALEHLRATIIRQQQQTSAILEVFAEARIDVIPLKGSWLSENIYDEASQRFMFDIDLLVKKSDIERAHLTLIELGYKATHDIRESTYVYDDSYYHPSYQKFIELHWNVESEEDESISIPDIEAIWKNIGSATLMGHPINEFSYENQLSHLVEHILHHKLAMSLKSYLDIALLLRKHGDELSLEVLTSTTRLWKTGKATPFILMMVSEIFETGIPEQLNALCKGVDPDLLTAASEVLFELPALDERAQEHNLLKYSQSSAAGRARLIFKRIFMPQAYMQIFYPFARNRMLLPAAWLLRLLHLLKTTGGRIASLDADQKNLKNARVREEITKTIRRSF